MNNYLNAKYKREREIERIDLMHKIKLWKIPNILTLVGIRFSKKSTHNGLRFSKNPLYYNYPVSHIIKYLFKYWIKKNIFFK